MPSSSKRDYHHLIATTPPTPQQPPPAPGPGASRDEWRAWRRQQRDYVRTQWPSWGGPGAPWTWAGSGWFWGAVLVVAGVYFLLSNLGLLTWLRGDILWPIVAILIGVWLILRRGAWWG